MKSFSFADQPNKAENNQKSTARYRQYIRYCSDYNQNSPTYSMKYFPFSH